MELSLDLAPPGQGSVLGHVLDVGAIVDQTTFGLHVLVNLAVPLGESPLLGNEDLQHRKRPQLRHHPKSALQDNSKAFEKNCQ